MADDLTPAQRDVLAAHGDRTLTLRRIPIMYMWIDRNRPTAEQKPPSKPETVVCLVMRRCEIGEEIVLPDGRRVWIER